MTWFGDSNAIRGNLVVRPCRGVGFLLGVPRSGPKEGSYIPGRGAIRFLSGFIELVRSVLVFDLKGTSGFSEVRDGEQVGFTNSMVAWSVSEQFQSGFSG
jgi:hypothetical protein